jgi:SAM-dependent methyltransferase
MTRRAAGLAPGGWDDDARREVAGLFDGLAAEWHTRVTPERTAVVADALRRGLDPLRSADPTGGTAVEVGSGLGTYTPMLVERFGHVLAVEIAEDMLRLADPATGHRVLADCSRLPLQDRSVQAVVAINAFLFPEEVDRVLVPGGCLVWVNVSGTETPIHLHTEDVLASLPFPTSGVEATAGAGTWCVLRRTP